LRDLSHYILLSKQLSKSFKFLELNTWFIICFSVFMSNMLVLKYTDLAVVDAIELSESESEEIEETEFDEFLQVSDIEINTIKKNKYLYSKSNLIIIRYFMDVFTPPPEFPTC